jgi:3-oxoadipate enol-lactonase
MPYVNVRGIRTNYRQEGRGPHVVLIHGVAGNMAGWYFCGLVHALAQHFHVTCYDLRGHGLSDTPLVGYTSRDLAEDLSELCRTLGLEQVRLLGHSFGGAIALHVADLEPERVAGVIVSDAYLPGLANIHGAPQEWTGWNAYKTIAASVGLKVSDDWENLDDLFSQAALLSPKERAALVEIVGEGTVDRLIRAASTTCGKDVAEIAGLTAERILAVQQPVVCLYGEQSPFRPLSAYLAQHLPHGREVLVPDAEHFAFEENPGAFVQLATRELCRMAGIRLAESANIESDASESVRRARTRMTGEGEQAT